ncbi:MAG: Signal transducer regulating beta-lactamase production, contains metallopeptidase domain [Mucilaginibacter sp.]|nr:Signal transducer regulating beta-lactamase production, contains metallopeptidase domain [Mucilaginibacter sp.]
MEPLIIYLLKANVVISILFLFYLLVLKNDKSFWQNRFYLLFSLLLSLFLPFLPELSFSHLDTIQRQITTANPLNSLYTTIGNSQMVNTHVNTAYVAVKPGFTPPSLMQTLVGAYLLVSFVLLIRLFIKLLKISILIKKTDKQFTGGIYYCAFDGTAPFSFFNYLVINKQLFNDRELQQIISHEKVHIRQWHSIDILFAELAHAILWVNPLMVYLKRCIKLNHEYIVDGEVINSGVNKKDYQLSILHSSLKLFQAYQLTNLYSSSKIKLRIKMMNLKKSPNTNAYKYAFVLLLVAASYFLINPSNASTLQKNVSGKSAKFDVGPLKAFEGLYQTPDKSAYIKLTEVNNVLVLKQLWDGREFSLKQKSELGFATANDAPFKFTKDKDGNVTQVLAFGQDVWLKANNGNSKEAALNTQQLKALEGIYQSEANKAAYVQVIAKQNTLITKQLWDGKEITMLVQSDVSFFVHVPYLKIVKFTKNDEGIATKFRASDKQDWNKVDSYQPPAEVKLTAQDLKKFEGYYEFKDRKGQFIQITATGNGLVLKQLWDNRQVDFTATSPLAFSAKENPEFTLQFTADNAGRITQVLAFGRDVWDRNDSYKAPVEIKLTAQDLKKLEGKYEFRKEKGQFIQISATDSGLVLKQLWDDQQIDFAATSPLSFFSKKQPGFTLQFTSDNAGHITQVLAFGQDVWDKVN